MHFKCIKESMVHVMDLVERVLRALSCGPKTTDEGAKQLGVSWATANGLLLQLAGSGKVKHVRKGTRKCLLS
ncbi:MAG: hypothetical protein KIH04_09170 [Candidatus Freyarchaeota archaeon]|nr:hypothetical protein [Candidatus Jordarchaeia archaeon]